MLYDLFNVLLDPYCQSFIVGFIYVHQRYWPVIFLVVPLVLSDVGLGCLFEIFLSSLGRPKLRPMNFPHRTAFVVGLGMSFLSQRFELCWETDLCLAVNNLRCSTLACLILRPLPFQ